LFLNACSSSLCVSAVNLLCNTLKKKKITTEAQRKLHKQFLNFIRVCASRLLFLSVLFFFSLRLCGKSSL
jgi:hypothetical protein